MRLHSLLLAVGVALLIPSAGYTRQDPRAPATRPLRDGVQEMVYRPGHGVTAPTIDKQVKPEYTRAARIAQVEGTVKLECVVSADGIVREARVIQPLHPSLDVEALRTVAEWRFKPGTKDRKPVAVRVEIEIVFALRDADQPRRGPAVDSPEVFKIGDSVMAPRVLHEVKPQYTVTAMRERVQGTVWMRCVVLSDGTVGDVQVTHTLHPDQDEEAVRTLRKWTFKPGTKDGVAVPVQVDVEMTFTLAPRR